MAFGVAYFLGAIIGTAQGSYALGIPAIVAGAFIVLIALTVIHNPGRVVLAVVVIYAGVGAITDQGNYLVGILLIVASPLIVMWLVNVWEREQAKSTPGRATGAAPRRQPIPERVRSEVWRRDQAGCVDCGSRERLEFDHIIPVSKGGSNTARNIELRCQTCNRSKGARI